MSTNTYVALQTQTLGSAVSSVTFDNIDQTYTDLVLEMSIQGVAGSGSGANTVFVTFNGDTTSGLYSRTILLADSGGPQSSRTSGQNRINLGNSFESASASSTFGIMNLNVQNYSNSTTNKTVLNRYGSNADRVGAVVGLWRNTNAITSLTITVDSSTGNIATGSTFTLNGIRAEGVSPAVKATGGTIYSDSTYYYHVFGSTGTFTPLSSLTADVLVVAGGGGGGGNKGGGGGAGGFRTATGLSVTATNYTVTVGAGGGASSSTGQGGDGTDSTFSTITSTGGGGGGGADAGGGSIINGRSGGSGGGSAQNGTGTPSVGLGNTPSTSPSQGNNGGAVDISTTLQPGGGGGAGGVGFDGVVGATQSQGGIGTSNFAAWAAATGVGQNVSGTYYLAGGGGGGSNQTGQNPAGGFGGGGTGGSRSTNDDTPGLANTGGGGGGGSTGSVATPGSAGGSGIVIVRYLKA